MKLNYSIYYEDNYFNVKGMISIEKLIGQKNNYDYFKVYLDNMIFTINHMPKMLLNKITSIISLRKNYISKGNNNFENEIYIYNYVYSPNNYDFKIINEDLSNKLLDKSLEKALLNIFLKNLFIGNEQMLITK
ncbi:putative toxin complex component ORF-X1 [Clostridium botulinum]|uniref:hypothetical protein n=1 Tax=Clostridium botulinum TaxID=1491 RepID=UPI000581CECB|nr:hypothetical protein [Clostridium botulinum]BAQ12785.1 putative toxin complex component ORF-X1 [Clostridium botulinum]